MIPNDEHDYVSARVPGIDLTPFESMSTDRELLATYWRHQYDRLDQIENQRIQFTNIVVAASVVAIALLFDRDDAAKSLALRGALATVLGVNLVACGYVLRMRQHAHQTLIRARTALRVLAPELMQLNMVSGIPRNLFHSSIAYQISLHALLGGVAALGVFIV